MNGSQDYNNILLQISMNVKIMNATKQLWIVTTYLDLTFVNAKRDSKMTI